VKICGSSAQKYTTEREIFSLKGNADKGASDKNRNHRDSRQKRGNDLEEEEGKQGEMGTRSQKELVGS